MIRLVAGLYALHVGSAALVVGLAHRYLPAALVDGRPAPDAFGWALTARLAPHDLWDAGFATLLVIALHAVVVGPLATGAALAKLDGQPALRGARVHYLALLRLRIVTTLAAGAVVALAIVVGEQLHPIALTWTDDRGHAALFGALAIVALPALLAVALVDHYAQGAIVVEGRGIGRALRLAGRTVRRRFGASLSWWALGWLGFGAATVAHLGGGGLLVAQGAALFRIGVRVGWWETARRLVKAESTRSGPDERTHHSAPPTPAAPAFENDPR